MSVGPAERIPIAQPAISQQLRRLEAELGEQLFHRDRRGIRLTPAGEALLSHARTTLQAAEGSRQAVAALSGLLTGRLTVGLVHPLPDRRFPRLLGAFHRAHPRIRLTLLEDQTDALLAALAAGQLQAVLIGQGRYDRPPPDLEALLVAREPVVAAVHPSHPLASRGSVPMAALRELLRWGRDVALRRLGRLATGPRQQQRVQQEDPAWLYATTRTLLGEEGHRP